jgi:hypothetical protein
VVKKPQYVVLPNNGHLPNNRGMEPKPTETSALTWFTSSAEQPFIAFRGNATGGVGGTYQQMFHYYFMFKRKEFLQH